MSQLILQTNRDMIFLYFNIAVTSLMNQKHTVNFLNQHLGCHLATDYTINTIITCKGNSWSQIIMSCMNTVHDI